MPRKVAVCAGLNAVDPVAYDGWSGELTACEADATSMSKLLSAQGFNCTVFYTKKATSAAVLGKLREHARTLVAGDVLCFTNSSHGGQVQDAARGGDEVDGWDETLCLWDREVIDDELWQLWSEFAAGVRIVMLSDSCHSGTVSRALGNYHSITAFTRNRAMPRDVAERVYAANKDMYDGLQSVTDRAAVKAKVLLISGCADNQTSLDGAVNGLFTGTLLKVWKTYQARGVVPSYRLLRQAINAQMPPYQTSQLYMATGYDSDFAGSPAFGG